MGFNGEFSPNVIEVALPPSFVPLLPDQPTKVDQLFEMPAHGALVDAEQLCQFISGLPDPFDAIDGLSAP